MFLSPAFPPHIAVAAKGQQSGACRGSLRLLSFPKRQSAIGLRIACAVLMDKSQKKRGIR
jgi:hypothetical protein